MWDFKEISYLVLTFFCIIGNRIGLSIHSIDNVYLFVNVYYKKFLVSILNSSESFSLVHKICKSSEVRQKHAGTVVWLYRVATKFNFI